MSAPASKRVAAQTPPERPGDPPVERERDSGSLRVRYGGLEVAAKGATVIYTLGLCVAAYACWRIAEAAGPVADQLRASAGVLAIAAEDAQKARKGVESLGRTATDLDRRLGVIETEVAAVRSELRAGCKR